MRTIAVAVAILCACFMQEVSGILVGGKFAVSSAPVNEATLKKEAESELKEETQGDEKIGDKDKKDKDSSLDEEDDAEDEDQDHDDESLAERIVQDAEDEEQEDDEDGKTLALEKVSEEDEEQDGEDSEDEEQEEDEDEELQQEMQLYIKKRVAQMSPSVQNLFAKVQELSKETNKDVVSEEAEAAADKAQKEFGKTIAKESVIDVVSEESHAALDEAHQEFGKAFAKELGHPADELAEKFAEDRQDQIDKYIKKRLASMSPSVNALYAKVEKLFKGNQKIELSAKAQEAEDQAFEEFQKAFAKELGLPMKGLKATISKLAMEDGASDGQVLKPMEKPKQAK